MLHSETGNFSSIPVLDVIVNGDDEHEHKEDTSSAQEMPDKGIIGTYIRLYEFLLICFVSVYFAANLDIQLVWILAS